MTTAAEGPTTARVVEALRRIIRAVDLHSRSLVQNHRLTGPQLVVLKAIAEGHPSSIGQLARAVHLSQATVTGILDRLEARGLVARKRSPDDRRRVGVCLSPGAEEKLRSAPPLLQEHFTRRFVELTEDEQARILDSLERVVSLMEAKGLDATPILATGPISATVERTEAFLRGPDETAGSGAPDHGEPPAGEPDP